MAVNKTAAPLAGALGFVVNVAKVGVFVDSPSVWLRNAAQNVFGTFSVANFVTFRRLRVKTVRLAAACNAAQNICRSVGVVTKVGVAGNLESLCLKFLCWG